ncbi:bifunctional adenosylcobinamide kinase/adenosylcobinamide-phosphate guanylyltransferase [Mycoplasmatota bacterium WC44]
MLSFISGGVRSGKSTFAEKLVKDNCTKRKVYIATAKVTDDEMRKRVLKHKNLLIKIK